MNEYERMVDLFEAIGVEYSTGFVTDFGVCWYGYPAKWEGYHYVTAAVDAQFVFDHNGRFVGVGSGDEQPSFDYRRQQ